jgi:hypothetical protein
MAREIMAWDALERQKRLRVGERQGGATVDVEADETVLGHWREHTEGEPDTHFWWIWLGIMVRGDPSSLWMHDCGIRSSRADATGAAKPPQLRASEWLEVLNGGIFSATSGAVLMTDSPRLPLCTQAMWALWMRIRLTTPEESLHGL